MEHEPPAPARPALGPDGATAVCAEWTRRTRAEYTSAAIASQVTLWLIQTGAPPDLIRDGLAVVDDELVHSELSAAVAVAADHGFVPPVVDPGSLSLAGAGDPARSLVAPILRFFCIGETVAVPLFRMLREHCSVPVARRALDRVLRDEARHRQFGWDVLDWMILAGGDAVRQEATDRVPAMLEEVTDVYDTTGGDGGDGRLDPTLAEWGMAAPSAYVRTLSVALAGDVVPRFGARGVHVAWPPPSP
ncbi:MAG: ferritin-like domain-containing protein [Actinobacteria bacterium]|nr:ferritin-like domain-containing protein [Actinomycetota bacterium]